MLLFNRGTLRRRRRRRRRREGRCAKEEVVEDGGRRMEWLSNQAENPAAGRRLGCSRHASRGKSLDDELELFVGFEVVRRTSLATGINPAGSDCHSTVSSP